MARVSMSFVPIAVVALVLTLLVQTTAFNNLPQRFYCCSSISFSHRQRTACHMCKSTHLPKKLHSKRHGISLNSESNSISSTEASATFLPKLRSVVANYSPLWTSIAAIIGLVCPQTVSTFGSVTVVSKSLSMLMLAMGLAITPSELQNAMKSSSTVLVLALNSLCCFVMMPLLALLVSNLLQLGVNEQAGTILLGCVSGGQASNLFALLAGGDVSLSVICTLSTTLLGAFVTPLLIRLLLGTYSPVDGIDVLKSVCSVVLLPVLTGLMLGCGLSGDNNCSSKSKLHIIPSKFMNMIREWCPTVGVGATLLLVAGGAANSSSFLVYGNSVLVATGASLLLPLFGAILTLVICNGVKLPERAKRTLVVEVLSKSPTLAYVLSLKHFGGRGGGGGGAAIVPAAGMVTLAALGALVSSIWRQIPIVEGEERERE